MNKSTKMGTLLGTLALASMLVFASQVANAAPKSQNSGVNSPSADYTPDTGSKANSVDTEAADNSVDTEAADIGTETEAADIASETPDVGDVASEVSNATPDN